MFYASCCSKNSKLFLPTGAISSFLKKKNADFTCIHTKCNNYHLMHTQSVSNISNLKKTFLWTWLPRKRKYSFFQFFQNPKLCLTIFYATSLKLRHVGHMYKSHFFPIFWLNIYLQETNFRPFSLKHAAPRDAQKWQFFTELDERLVPWDAQKIKMDLQLSTKNINFPFWSLGRNLTKKKSTSHKKNAHHNVADPLGTKIGSFCLFLKNTVFCRYQGKTGQKTHFLSHNSCA